MTTPILKIDAFTDQPFAGNPAAVCFLEDQADESWMQNLAMENNLSETAFVRPIPEGGYELRWFTPAYEVDLCGHATLAAAHALWESGRLDETEEARFQTRSGALTCHRNGGWIEMDFPAEPAEPIEPPVDLLEALGVARQVVTVARNRMDLLVQMATEGDLRALNPDYRRLNLIDTRGVIVTAPSEQTIYDFVSRFFAPAAGVDEDPVTGSAHCCLGPWWADRLGSHELVGFQASARGGKVRVTVGENGRVTLAGQAVTVIRGEVL
ncbi:MAG: PhzF family phenazine biosynthesis protein [Phycisphaerae bacterium]